MPVVIVLSITLALFGVVVGLSNALLLKSEGVDFLAGVSGILGILLCFGYFAYLLLCHA